MERRKRQRPPSQNYTQHDQPVHVTVLTQQFIDQPHDFDETTLGGLTPDVQGYHSRWPEDLVIIVAEVSKPTRSRRDAAGNDMGEFYSDLKAQLSEITKKRFPRHIIDSVVDERLHQPYVPGEGGGVRGNVAWALKYRGGNGDFPNHPKPSSEEAIDLLTEKTSIGAWVGRRQTGEKVLPPMAVIIFLRDQHIISSHYHFYVEMMIDQYRETNKYWWNYVRDQPLWLFMDLYRLINNFKTNIATADWEINKCMEPESYGRRHEVIPRVARLRDALLLLAEFRQDLKTHEIAQKSIEKIVQHNVDQQTYSSEAQYPSVRLCDKLYELGNDLETLNLRVDMLREQCLYLMDSEFNTVAARTDARLGILTILAFVLTPAGFVVSLFSVIDAGTTQLIVSTVLVGFFSIVVYVVIDGLYRRAEQKQLPSAIAAPQREHIYGYEKRRRSR